MTRIYQVDAFADRVFRGNPAAVCPLDAATDDSLWMQALATEMNLSETAFLWPEADAWRLRWFTPAAEVELCGHATLASAHVLWQIGRQEVGRPIPFQTLSGRLTAGRDGELITLDFPAVASEPREPIAGLESALGAGSVSLWHSRWDLLAELPDADAVRNLVPDFRALAQLDYRAVLVTAAGRGSGEDDFVSRCFAPALGIDEDPVTGSAHCQLAPYWAGRLGKNRMWGHQLSDRGGRGRRSACRCLT